MIATTAMNKYLQSKEGATADLWEMVVQDILQPLKVQSGAWTSVRTYDTANIAFGGYGLFWLQDDVAKITNFFSNGGGAINGVQVLHKASVDAALQRVPSDRGLDCNYPANGDEPRIHRYNYGTWEQEYSGSQVGCSVR